MCILPTLSTLNSIANDLYHMEFWMDSMHIRQRFVAHSGGNFVTAGFKTNILYQIESKLLFVNLHNGKNITVSQVSSSTFPACVPQSF